MAEVVSIIGLVLLLGGMLMIFIGLFDRVPKIIRNIGTVVFVASLLLAIATPFIPHECPNCDEGTRSPVDVRCEICGHGACPQCEKEFGFNKVPAYCPDCGTKVKE